MSMMIKPVGDRLLVKLVRLSEKKIGETVITLANTDKKRYQAECSKAVVIAGGTEIPENLAEGNLVLIRSDAGCGLTADILGDTDARLYRIIEYPEVLAVLEEVKDITDANDVCKQMEVV